MRRSCGALVFDEVIEAYDADRQSIPRRCDRIADHCDALDVVDPARHVYAQGRVAEERHLCPDHGELGVMWGSFGIE